MTLLHQLPSLVTRRKKRLGQGWASGAGKTSGRGTKGQHAREKVKSLFEGGQNILSKHLPMLRGKLKNDPIVAHLLPISLRTLEENAKVKSGATIDKDFLVSIGLVNHTKANRHGVVVLGGGTITKKLIVKVKASQSAIQKIKQAGGEYQY
ncbi:MAG: 50S ribosomal protein L15 [Patescibacteria group bacterium]|jgi:large subunit ribosomal protein L15